MADKDNARPAGNTWVGVVAGILVGLLVVLIGFWTIRPQGTVATPSPSPTATSPALGSPSPTPTVPSMSSGTPSSGSPTPSSTITTSATPTPTAIGSASPSPTPTVSTPVPGIVTSLTPGSYIAVLRSVPKRSVTAEEAVAQAASMTGGGYAAVAIDADQIPGLKNGYYAIAVPNLGSYAEVKKVCSALNIPGGNRCYPRAIRG